MIRSCNYGPSLLGVIQGLSPSRRNLHQQVFRALRSLNITLPLIILQVDDSETDEVNFARTFALIQSAPLLELELKFDM